MNSLPTVWAVAIALVVAVLGTAGVTSLLTVRAVNRKTLAGARLDEESATKADAEARKLVSEASAFLIEPLTKRAKDLELDLATASAELASLRSQMNEMAKELTQLRDENTRLRERGEEK